MNLLRIAGIGVSFVFLFAGCSNPVRDEILDQDFINQASDYCQSEVSLGRLTQDKAGQRVVQDFASVMVKDHARMNKRLIRIAWDQGLALPDPVVQQPEVAGKFESLSGPEFDRYYIADQIARHREAIRLFETQGRNASGALGAFASEMLPVLRVHLKRAEQVDGMLRRSQQ